MNFHVSLRNVIEPVCLTLAFAGAVGGAYKGIESTLEYQAPYMSADAIADASREGAEGIAVLLAAGVVAWGMSGRKPR